MKIHYELTLDDYIAFQEYAAHANPGAPKPMSRGSTAVWIAAGIMCVAFASFELYVQRTWGPFTIGVAIMAGLYPLLRFVGAKFSPRAVAVKQHREGQLKDVLGAYELELSSGGLVQRHHGQTHAWHDLTTLERVVETDALVLIFDVPRKAIAIPRRDVPEGDLARFLDALRAAMRGERTDPDTRVQDLGR